MTQYASSNSKRKSPQRDAESSNIGEKLEGESLPLSSIIGEFGIFQLIVLIFSTIREGCTAYDSVVTSVFLKPAKSYVCAQGSYGTLLNENLTTFKQNQCYQLLNQSSHFLKPEGEMVACSQWNFNNITEMNDKSTYLTVKWQLVCNREWLLALIETIFFVGIVFGNLFWGYMADTYGRKPAYLGSHLLSLVSGLAAIYIDSYWLFVACRFLHGFGASGYFITYSMYSEVIGARLRSGCSVISHFGWGAFLIMLPFINHHSADYRHLLAVSPLVSLITLPIALWLPESSRLLMAKGEYRKSREILQRIVRINRIKTPELELEKKLSSLEGQVKIETDRAIEERKGKNLYAIIFTNPRLLKDTLIMSYLCFLGQLLYFVLTLNFYFIDNLSVDDNFIKSGIGEWIGILTLLLLLRYLSRRSGFRIYLVILTMSFASQYLIDIGILSSLNTRWFVVINNGLGNLCTANVLFLTLSVVLEVYPTVARDTGKSIVCSILEIGSTMAPMLIQLSRLVGNDKINLLVVFMSTFGLVLSEFLTVADQSELSNV